MIPDGIRVISAEAFSDCKTVRSVIIPEGVRSIGKRAFLGCVALESVKLPSTLEKIGDLAFAGCARLDAVSIPKGIAISEDAYSENNGDIVATMYMAKGNSLRAKFYIRYSFSEGFLPTLARLKAKKTVPVITTCDPNITNDLLRALVGAEGASDYAPKVRRIFEP